MKNKAKRIVSAVCALAMCAAMLPAAAMAEETTTSGPVSENGVTIDKTATALDENDQTKVELTIGSSESKEKAAVMFLLDKSTSQGMRDEAAKMLDELASKSNTDILYNVVIFSGTATSTGWQDIQDSDTLDEIKENFVNGTTTSGTNMDAGIEKAIAEMSTLPSDFTDATTYLVTLSDGITYVWTGGDNEVKCVPVQGMGANDTVENPAQNGSDTWSMMYEYGKSLADVYAADETNISTIMDKFKAAVESKMQATIAGGHVQNYYDETAKNNPITTYVYDDEKTAEVAAKYACGIDFAVYESAVGYENLVTQFDYSYAYAVPELMGDNTTDNTKNWENYPWGKELMAYCHSLSTNKNEGVDVSNADAEKIFSSIKDQILYTIQSGTVTDVIGDHFDLTDITSFQLTVGGNSLTSTVDKEHNTVTFTDSNGGNYVVTYYPATADNSEYFTWDINAPVAKDAPLSLTYTLQLVNKETKPGTYTPPTNVSATLDYTPTVGDEGSLDFPVPHVKYTVEALKPDDPTYDELNALLDAEVQCTTTTDHATDHTDLLDGSYDVTVDATDADSRGDGAIATVTVNSDPYVQHYNDNMNTGLTHTLASGAASTWTVQLVYVANETTTGWTLADGQEDKVVFYVSCPETTTVPGTPSTPTPDEHPDIAEGIANGTWGGTPTPTPTAQTTAIPQTSDDLPLGLLIVVAIAAAGAVCGLVVLRKRSKQ